MTIYNIIFNYWHTIVFYKCIKEQQKYIEPYTSNFSKDITLILNDINNECTRINFRSFDNRPIIYKYVHNFTHYNSKLFIKDTKHLSWIKLPKNYFNTVLL